MSNYGQVQAGEFPPRYHPPEIWGFINRSGQVVIKPRFDWTRPFRDGVSCVKLKDGPLIWINHEGEKVPSRPDEAIAPRLFDDTSFHEGLAAVRVNVSGKQLIAFIDVNQKVVIGPRFLDTTGFSEGLAAVSFDKDAELLAHTGAFEQSELTNDQKFETFRERLARVVQPYSKSFPLRIAVSFDANGVIEDVVLESGGIDNRIGKKIVTTIGSASLPQEPCFNARHCGTVDLLLAQAGVEEAGSALDPQSKLLGVCAKLEQDESDTFSSHDEEARERIAQKLVGIYSQIYPIWNRKLAETLSTLAETAIDNKHYKIAEEAIRHHMLISTKSAHIGWARSKTYTFDGHFSPDDFIDQYAFVLQSQGKGKAAEDVLRNYADRVNGEYERKEAYFVLGDFYYLNRKFDQAEACYKRSLALTETLLHQPLLMNQFEQRREAYYAETIIQKYRQPSDAELMGYEKDLYAQHFGAIEKLAKFYASLKQWKEAEKFYDALVAEMSAHYKRVEQAGCDWFSEYECHLLQSGQFKKAAIVNNVRVALNGLPNENAAIGQCKYVNYAGGKICKMPIALAGHFSDGLAQVQFCERVGFVDKQGNLVIPFDFTKSSNFTEGLAPVVPPRSFADSIILNYGRPHGEVTPQLKTGYIDKAGALKIPAIFEEGKNFSGGLAAVKLSIGANSWRLIDTTGTIKTKAGSGQ